jgi:hypothetical protein
VALKTASPGSDKGRRRVVDGSRRAFCREAERFEFERIDFIGPAASVGGWDGAEARTRPWFCRQNARGGQNQGRDVALTRFLGVEITSGLVMGKVYCNEQQISLKFQKVIS